MNGYAGQSSVSTRSEGYHTSDPIHMLVLFSCEALALADRTNKAMSGMDRKLSVSRISAPDVGTFQVDCLGRAWSLSRRIPCMFTKNVTFSQLFITFSLGIRFYSIRKIAESRSKRAVFRMYSTMPRWHLWSTISTSPYPNFALPPWPEPPQHPPPPPQRHGCSPNCLPAPHQTHRSTTFARCFARAALENLTRRGQTKARP